MGKVCRSINNYDMQLELYKLRSASLIDYMHFIFPLQFGVFECPSHPKREHLCVVYREDHKLL